MSVYMLKIRLKEAQAELANAIDQDAIDQANLRIRNIKDAIFEVEMIEFGHPGDGGGNFQMAKSQMIELPEQV